METEPRSLVSASQAWPEQPTTPKYGTSSAMRVSVEKTTSENHDQVQLHLGSSLAPLPGPAPPHSPDLTWG